MRKDINLAVKHVVCKVDGNEIVIEKEALVSGFKKYTTSRFPTFKCDSKGDLCHSLIYGNFFIVPDPEKKKRIDITLVMEVALSNKKTVEGTVHATFFSKSRTYLVSVFGFPVIA